jgi:hypothetical protein
MVPRRSEKGCLCLRLNEGLLTILNRSFEGIDHKDVEGDRMAKLKEYCN